MKLMSIVSLKFRLIIDIDFIYRQWTAPFGRNMEENQIFASNYVGDTIAIIRNRSKSTCIQRKRFKLNVFGIILNTLGMHAYLAFYLLH